MKLTQFFFFFFFKQQNLLHYNSQQNLFSCCQTREINKYVFSKKYIYIVDSTASGRYETHENIDNSNNQKRIFFFQNRFIQVTLSFYCSASKIIFILKQIIFIYQRGKNLQQVNITLNRTFIIKLDN
eukprot:TRINITY_DN3130_c0_g1_i13.p2 TRINITY_DN3130_c0_g1~~TRINITY_DN3130_c0_g1_i13.p2  ORF type:complete len:127 (-),score=1.89 TRINITY_DN3130_c0_g1_i13:242-622(-)